MVEAESLSQFCVCFLAVLVMVKDNKRAIEYMLELLNSFRNLRPKIDPMHASYPLAPRILPIIIMNFCSIIRAYSIAHWFLGSSK